MRVAVVIRHSGEREVIMLTADDDEAVLTISFSGAQACARASALTGTFQSGRHEASDG